MSESVPTAVVVLDVEDEKLVPPQSESEFARAPEGNGHEAALKQQGGAR